jgi:quercetin dioxygenase-like cupin family protein
MNSPEIKIIALSNVFSRLMFFNKKGDIEQGHTHTYDHATLVSSGSVLVEILDETGKPEQSKVFESPNMIYINKNKAHRLIALEDKTVCVCIHAIRTIDEEIVDPEFLIEPVFSKNRGEVRELVEQVYGKKMQNFN